MVILFVKHLNIKRLILTTLEKIIFLQKSPKALITHNMNYPNNPIPLYQLSKHSTNCQNLCKTNTHIWLCLNNNAQIQKTTLTSAIETTNTFSNGLFQTTLGRMSRFALAFSITMLSARVSALRLGGCGFNSSCVNAFLLLDTQRWDYVDVGRVGFDQPVMLERGTAVGHCSARKWWVKSSGQTKTPGL